MPRLARLAALSYVHSWDFGLEIKLIKDQSGIFQTINQKTSKENVDGYCKQIGRAGSCTFRNAHGATVAWRNDRVIAGCWYGNSGWILMLIDCALAYWPSVQCMVCLFQRRKNNCVTTPGISGKKSEKQPKQGEESLHRNNLKRGWEHKDSRKCYFLSPSESAPELR